MLKGYLSIIIPHDFLFFCSRDYNTQGIMEEVIGNYALMYALNNNINEIHRVFSGTDPFYSVDMKKMRSYSTPAYHISKLSVPNKIMKELSRFGMFENKSLKEIRKITFTYNAVGESVAFGMTPATLNIPNLGSYEKYPPLQVFISFIFGKRGPSVIRLGKKQISCRMVYFEFQSIKEASGLFTPDHPINIHEIQINSENLKSGQFIYVKPAPLIVKSQLFGNYLGCKLEKQEYIVSIPDKSLYPSVFSDIT